MKLMKCVQAFHLARRAPFAPIVLLGCMWAGAASTNFVVYSDHTCNAISDLSCAFVMITVTGDTSTVTAFSVPMAS